MTGISQQDRNDSGSSYLYSAVEWDFLMQQTELTFRAGCNRYAFGLARKDGSRLPVIISSRILQNSEGPFRIAFVNSRDPEHVALLVCDVSGHGLGSALIANRIYSEAIAHLRSDVSFVDAYTELNRFLIKDIAGSGMFVTVAAARINTQRRRMVFAGAGHPPAILACPGQNPVLFQSRSVILGVLPEAALPTTSMEVQLEQDDRILIYTAGITEVFNSRGEMLGTEGIREIIRQTSCLPANEMKQGILDAVAAWRNGPPTDDVSLAETDHFMR